MRVRVRLRVRVRGGVRVGRRVWVRVRVSVRVRARFRVRVRIRVCVSVRVGSNDRIIYLHEIMVLEDPPRPNLHRCFFLQTHITLGILFHLFLKTLVLRKSIGGRSSQG